MVCWCKKSNQEQTIQRNSNDLNLKGLLACHLTKCMLCNEQIKENAPDLVSRGGGGHSSQEFPKDRLEHLYYLTLLMFSAVIYNKRSMKIYKKVNQILMPCEAIF